MTGTEVQPGSEHADGVIDLLGMLAYASLSSYFRLSADASVAASLPDRVVLAEMAVGEYDHFRRLQRRLEELNADPNAAMQPFVQALDAFHASTRPADWLEGLVKAYVGDGFSADFYRTVADLADPETHFKVLLELYQAELGKDKPVPPSVVAVQQAKRSETPAYAEAISDLNAALIDHIQVPDSDLEALGKQRAQAIQGALVADGQVETSRVFVVSAPAKAPSGEKVKIELALR